MSRAIKKFLGFLIFSIFLVNFTLPASAASKKILHVGGNAIGSIQYVFACGIGDVVEKHTNYKFEVKPHGNVITLPMFQTKEIDMAIASNEESHYAYNGKEVYGEITDGKGIDLRMLMLGTRVAAGLVVARDSGITSAKELKGKKVVIDYGAHFGLSMGTRAGLYGVGLTEDDVKAVKANTVPEAMKMVIEGKADACFGAIGVPAFRELEAARGALHLGIDDTTENWKKIHEIFYGYFPIKVKPGYFSVKQPIVLVGKNFALICRADLSDDVAYQVTKTIWEHDAELAPYAPGLKDWVKARFVATTSSAPYHPGAVKFYKEQGVWTDEMQKHQEKLLTKK